MTYWALKQRPLGQEKAQCIKGKEKSVRQEAPKIEQPITLRHLATPEEK